MTMEMDWRKDDVNEHDACPINDQYHENNAHSPSDAWSTSFSVENFVQEVLDSNNPLSKISDLPSLKNLFIRYSIVQYFRVV